MISPLAFVSPEAKIGQNVTIHPFAYIDADVEIGDNCVIMPSASIMAGTRMGKNNQVSQGCVLGAMPQDFAYKGDKTTLQIGDNNVFRENVVVNRATCAGGSTVIGNGNFVFEGVHISHDTKVADNCVFGYGTKIAGNCLVQSNAIFSTCVILDQGCRVGAWSMIQGGCHVNRDVPPYIIAARHPISYYGINTVVLSHEGFSSDTISVIAQAYSMIYQSNTSVLDAVLKIKEQMDLTPEIENILSFINESKRGIIKYK